MKLAFAKDIEFKEGYNRKSPAYYETLIMEKFKDTDIQFDGFILPFKGARNTKIQLSNKKTGGVKQYSLDKWQHLTGDVLTHTESYYYEMMEKKCTESGKKFNGWLEGWRGSDETVCDIQCMTHDVKINPLLKVALHKNYQFQCSECVRDAKLLLVCKVGSMEELRVQREKQLIEYLNSKKYRFVKWDTPQSNIRNTYAVCDCPDHGHFRVSLRSVNEGTAMCPTCNRILHSMASGMVCLSRTKGVNTPYSIYLQTLGDKFIKFGVSSNPENRLKIQQYKSAFTHELVYTHEFKKGWQAVDLEYGIHTTFKGKKARQKDVPDGWTETRHIKCMPEIIKFIEDYISSNPTKPVYITDEYEFWSKIGSDFELDESQFTFPDTSDEEYYSNLAELDLSPLEAL